MYDTPRRHPRFKVTLSGKTLDSRGMLHSTFVEDLSLGGMKCYLPVPLLEKSRIVVMLELPWDGPVKSICSDAIVLRSDPNNQRLDHYATALQFEDMDKDDRTHDLPPLVVPPVKLELGAYPMGEA